MSRPSVRDQRSTGGGGASSGAGAAFGPAADAAATELEMIAASSESSDPDATAASLADRQLAPRCATSVAKAREPAVDPPRIPTSKASSSTWCTPPPTKGATTAISAPADRRVPSPSATVLLCTTTLWPPASVQSAR